MRDAIQRIAVEMPAYGSRRITAELRRQGWVINRKRVQRMMRQDNLLCLRRKKFIRTTDSEHGLAVYPNLVPTLDSSAVNQLWVADITYIRLRSGVSQKGMDRDEMEANRFAAEVLMPIEFLRADLESNEFDLADGDQFCAIAKRYGVSTQALAIRLNGLGYAPAVEL